MESNKYKFGKFLHLKRKSWPTKCIGPASQEEDLDGLIAIYQGKINKMADPEPPTEVAVNPNKLFNPNQTEQKNCQCQLHAVQTQGEQIR